MFELRRNYTSYSGHREKNRLCFVRKGHKRATLRLLAGFFYLFRRLHQSMRILVPENLRVENLEPLSLFESRPKFSILEIQNFLLIGLAESRQCEIIRVQFAFVNKFKGY